MEASNLTPVRKQYLEIKQNYPDTIVFFRLGDFYETFDHDAEITSQALDIVLTSRNVAKGQRIPMAGIPYHAAENYIGKLIEKGYRIAICEQVGEQPQRGLFPRQVVRVITAGTLIEPGLLQNEKNNYIFSIFPLENQCGLAFADITTGQFQTSQVDSDADFLSVHAEIERLQPKEILLPESIVFPHVTSGIPAKLADWKFEEFHCIEVLKTHFGVASIEGLGLKELPLAVRASGALLQYIKETNPSNLTLLNELVAYNTHSFMVLDSATRRNLELTESMRDQNDLGTLLKVIDRTVTPMGKRLIRQRINQPLLDISEINKRLDYVELFCKDGIRRVEIVSVLKSLCDIERVINRIRTGIALPRDLVALRSTLHSTRDLTKIINEDKTLIDLDSFTKFIFTFDGELELLETAIVEDPPATLQHSGVIAAGYSEELDQIKSASRHARDWIANLETSEKKRTGIKTLKVGFNNVFGYYIEISKSAADQAPSEYIRKQTLVNGERFITPELKEYESLVLNAEERIREIENRLFKHICKTLSASADRFLISAHAIAELDYYLSLAECAIQNQYCRPQLTTDPILDIHDSRHPVVEKAFQINQFVPNDCVFETGEFIRVITGPNMSGKSTFLRQVALIVLLAQIGSYVPAKEARIGLVDRIFTRIGAQDEIFSGQSTFMVEMTETANILHSATSQSLIIMDEIGRGTSTYDGLAIAWSVIEHIHHHPRLRARTLFATHFHELIKLRETLPGVRNYNVAVSDMLDPYVPAHKIGSGDITWNEMLEHIARKGKPDAFLSTGASDIGEVQKGRPHHPFSQPPVGGIAMQYQLYRQPGEL